MSEIRYNIEPETKLFLNSSLISDLNQINAINYLVAGLKDSNIWTKMKAIYPFVGGTASSHKWNLKDPRNLDAAFRLTFYGTITHSATGCLPDGNSGYAYTYLNPSNDLVNTSVHMSYYSRTQSSLPENYLMGCGEGSFKRFIMYISASNYGYLSGTQIGDGYANQTYYFDINSKIFQIGTLYGGNNSLYRNGVCVNYSNTQIGKTLPNKSVTLFCANLNGVSGFENKECAFSSIGDGLTDTDALNLYNIVQNYQKLLNRNV